MGFVLSVNGKKNWSIALVVFFLALGVQKMTDPLFGCGENRGKEQDGEGQWTGVYDFGFSFVFFSSSFSTIKQSTNVGDCPTNDGDGMLKEGYYTVFVCQMKCKGRHPLQVVWENCCVENKNHVRDKGYNKTLLKLDSEIKKTKTRKKSLQEPRV